MGVSMQPKLSLVFFGNGPVAHKSLEFLNELFEIELVITKRRPPHHKDPAPVETYANQQSLPVAFADTKQELETIIGSKQLESTCGVVIDYGVIISQTVIDSFAHGILNSHFSILPEWRGADPITFSLLSGQKQTGVSLMQIDAGLDTGPMIAETPVSISPDETGKSLTAKLIETSNAQIAAVLPLYLNGAAIPLAQDAKQAIVTYSRKLTKQDGILDTTKPASMLEREVRAFGDWPKTKLVINNDLTVIITRARALSTQLPQGKVQLTNDDHLVVGTRLGSLDILELMPLGKKNMPIQAFLNGYRQHLPQE